MSPRSNLVLRRGCKPESDVYLIGRRVTCFVWSCGSLVGPRSGSWSLEATLQPAVEFEVTLVGRRDLNGKLVDMNG